MFDIDICVALVSRESPALKCFQHLQETSHPKSLTLFILKTCSPEPMKQQIVQKKTFLHFAGNFRETSHFVKLA